MAKKSGSTGAITFGRGYRAPTRANVLALVLIAVVAFVIDAYPPVQVLDHRIETTWLQNFLLIDKPSSFVVVAVDGNTAQNIGCPPYDATTLKKIDAGLAAIDIKRMVLPEGPVTLMDPTSALPKKHQVRYLTPTVMSWDTYAKRWQEIPPLQGAGLDPIEAVSIITADASGTVQRFPDAQSIFGGRAVMAWWMANQIKPGVRMPETGELIRFRGAAGTVPTLSVNRIIDGDFSSKDVAGRLPVWGITASRCRPLYSVPTDRNGMSGAELFVHMADTLFESPIRHMHMILRAFFIVLIAGLVMFWLRRMRLGFRAIFSGLFIVVWLAVSFMATLYYNLLLPVIAPITAILLVFGYLNIEQTFTIVKELRENNRRLAKEVENWVYSSELLQEVSVQDSFEELVGYASGFVDIKKAYLFVLPQNAWHLRMVASIDGSEADVRERRRDIRRKPWQSAISNATGASLRGFLHDRYFNAYGIPILDFGKMLGIVVISTERGVEMSEPTRQLLERLAYHMGNVLVGIESLYTKQGMVKKIVRAIQEADAIQQELVQTNRITNLVVNQIGKYRALLERIDIGVMFGDLMGNIYYSNEFAKEFLKESGIGQVRNFKQIVEHTRGERSRSTREFIESATCGMDIPPQEWEDPETKAMYQISLAGLSINPEEDDSAVRSGATALLMTVQDVTRSRQLDGLKSQAMYLASFKGRNIITGLAGFSSLLIRMAKDPIVKETAKELVGLTDQLEGLFADFSQLAERIGVSGDEAIKTPFDIVAVITDTVTRMTPDAEKKGLTLAANTPLMSSPVVGDWSALQDGVVAVLGDIIKSCYSGQEISVSVLERKDHIELEIIDPSVDPGAMLLDAIENRRWSDISPSLAQGLRAFDEGMFMMVVERREDVGMAIRLMLEKL